MSEEEKTLQNDDAAIAEAAAKEAMAEVGEAEGGGAAAEEEKEDAPALQEVDFETEEMKYTGTAIAKNQEGAQEGAEAPPTLTIDNYVKHGYGVEINKEEGTKYEGQFKNGRHHGIGKLSYEATGDTYEGDWVDGEIEGEGKFNFSNGDVFLGQFKNN